MTEAAGFGEYVVELHGVYRTRPARRFVFEVKYTLAAFVSAVPAQVQDVVVVFAQFGFEVFKRAVVGEVYLRQPAAHQGRECLKQAKFFGFVVQGRDAFGGRHHKQYLEGESLCGRVGGGVGRVAFHEGEQVAVVAGELPGQVPDGGVGVRKPEGLSVGKGLVPDRAEIRLPVEGFRQGRF